MKLIDIRLTVRVPDDLPEVDRDAVLTAVDEMDWQGALPVDEELRAEISIDVEKE